MTAKIRQIERQFRPPHSAKFKNLLVNGCSLTWNNSENKSITWPYYLRDLCQFEQVFDCSNPGAGNNHIFYSTVNEIEINDQLDPAQTLVVIYWSGLTRVDTISTTAIDPYVNKDSPSFGYYLKNRYAYFDDLVTVPFLTRYQKVRSMLDELIESYFKLIDDKGQILQSAVNILTLYEYLRSKKFTTIFLYWEPMFEKTLEIIPRSISHRVGQKMTHLKSLAEYAQEKSMIVESHPGPDAHLNWARDYLIPYMESQQWVEKL